MRCDTHCPDSTGLLWVFAIIPVAGAAVWLLQFLAGVIGAILIVVFTACALAAAALVVYLYRDGTLQFRRRAAERARYALELQRVAELGRAAWPQLEAPRVPLEGVVVDDERAWWR